MSLKSALSLNVLPATYNSAGGAAAPKAYEIVSGYVYIGAAGAAVNLTLPATAALISALDAKNILPPAGSRAGYVFPYRMLVLVTDTNALTVTAGDVNTTIGGGAAVNNTAAAFTFVMTADDKIKVMRC